MTTQSRPVLEWHFPLPRTHTGVLIGNGLQGLMVWGVDSLNITIARAGFWDHRGGQPFSPQGDFASLRKLVEARDEAGVLRLVSGPPRVSGGGRTDRPQQLGGGRLELRFPDGLKPTLGKLQTSDAVLDVTLTNATGRTAMISIHQAFEPIEGGELAWVVGDKQLLAEADVRLVPVWDVSRNPLADIGIAAPSRWTEHSAGGFIQTLPDDAPLAVAWQRANDGVIAIATSLGDVDGSQSRGLVAQGCDAARREGLRSATDRWWAGYWRDVPSVELPDAELQHAYDYGVYKQAGMTPPTGVAATLQGPWMEEYQIPPWSNDYHFNINVEMVYGPCLATNRASHLVPLWDLVRSWFPLLRDSGERFFGAPGAMMLPHAVDDRCAVVGTFWTGTIDHGCTAWVALMAWQHYRYTLDRSILTDMAWPLLNGAFNGFYAMCERVTGDDGHTRLSLPVSVSPEYNASRMDAWGRDASFQLAAAHRVAEVLDEVSRLLELRVDPRWAELRDRLPAYTLIKPKSGSPRIGLWEGQDLAESHRHHSHLASIYPFCSIDPYASDHQKIVGATIGHWNTIGPGQWTGWCIPWAAILCARLGLADAASLWLTFWKRNFTNEGHGTLHNADRSGVTAWADGALGQEGFRRPSDRPNDEVMQMDAGMGALTAILELLVQCRRDAIYVMPAIPKHWRDVHFSGIRAEGAVLISATVQAGRLIEVEVVSEKGGPLRLAHDLGSEWSVDGVSQTAPLYTANLAPGQRVTLRRAASPNRFTW